MRDAKGNPAFRTSLPHQARGRPTKPKAKPSSAPVSSSSHHTQQESAWPLPHRAGTGILGSPGSLSETLPSSQNHTLKNSQSSLSEKKPSGR